RGLLDPASLAELAAGRMLVRRLPGDPDHLAILFAGENTATVGRAVEGFVAGAGRPLDPPPLPEIDGGAVLTLAELGFRTRELPLGVTEPLDLTFRLPPSFYAADGQRLELALNYAYAGGLQPTSALVIEVNGIPANMIRLDDPRGRIVDGARVGLTLGTFHPGINRISIYPMLDPASAKACESGAPMLSLFQDSRITMPDFARLTHGGQLYDLVDDGFPYGEEPAAVMVSARDPAALGAAWTFLGKLAQRRGEVLDRLSFVPPGSTPTEHLIAVGTAAELSPSLVARLDLPWTEPTEPPAVPVAAGAANTPVAASVPDPRAEWQSRIGPEGGEGLLERLR
ncbi:cellulose biosynthesis cyclic di-GMP-binding regulatory protein BcsB, partial [Geminicoccus harenae]